MPDTTALATDPETSATPSHPRWMIGIAASAGGLEAVSTLAQSLPADINAVYVVAQHMSPTHKSVLASLIARETDLPVVELDGETRPESDTIYITPPNKDVVFDGTVLMLREPSGHPASPKPSADRLFISLAENVGDRCLGIVMSGTGSDGSYGVQSIREAGGITIAQEPMSAKYDGMPSSAIQTGCVDLTLKPTEIGQHLRKILALPRDWEALRPTDKGPGGLTELFSILKARTNVDFSDYRENTLNRRITRRMAALGIADYEQYVDFCRTHEGEVEALHRDLLISVTRFFRDPDQFERLKEELVERFANRGDVPVRIWIVGCATGEEAYSVAILLYEAMGGIDVALRASMQVFATDIDSNAIEVARRGVYPLSAAADIPDQYLKDYFIIGESEITVRPELRTVTLFSHHNVIQDPPFINLDLVSIRNVLIYFNQSLQERVLSRLHYALSTDGVLFLGTSETVGELALYFERREGSDKIHIKRRGGADSGFRFDSQSAAPQLSRRAVPGRARVEAAAEEARSAHAEASLARSVAENGFICTSDGKIIEFLGDTTPFVQISPGVAKTPSVNMLMEPLRNEALSLLAIARRNGRKVEGRWHSVELPMGNRAQMQVFPFENSPGGEAHCLVSINTRFEEPSPVGQARGENDDQRDYIQRMEQEVRSTREALQQTIEELQTANEELQSANEELLSTNEEFQATNEELETSNEELQSTNEELITVNEELQVTSAERQALASELEATLLSSPYAIAFADPALMVRRASRVALDLFGLKEIPPSGTHLSQAAIPQGFPPLAPMANEVLKLQETRVVPVRGEAGLLSSLTVAPVVDAHEKPMGVSLLVTRQDAASFERLTEMLSDSASIGYWTLEPSSEVIHWSSQMYDIFGRDAAMGPPQLSEGLGQIHPEDEARVGALFQKALTKGEDYDTVLRIVRPDGQLIAIRSSVSVLMDESGSPIMVMGVIWDLGSTAEREVLLSNYEAVQDDLDIGFFSFNLLTQEATWNKSLYSMLGYDPETHVPSVESGLDIIHPDDRERVDEMLQTAMTDGKDFTYTARIMRADGEALSCACIGRVRKDVEGVITHVFGSFRIDVEKA